MPNVELPTDRKPRPKITQSEQMRLLQELSVVIVTDPLQLPARIANAYADGASVVALARWFEVPASTMRDLINKEILGFEEHARIMMRRQRIRAEATVAKRSTFEKEQGHE